jgi:hypothetical protein
VAGCERLAGAHQQGGEGQAHPLGRDLLPPAGGARLEAGAAALIAARVPVRLDEERVAALCAALLVTRDLPLADLASALDITIPRVLGAMRPCGRLSAVNAAVSRAPSDGD